MAQTYKKARAEAAVRDLVRHWLLVQEEMAQVKDPDTLRYVEGKARGIREAALIVCDVFKLEASDYFPDNLPEVFL